MPCADDLSPLARRILARIADDEAARAADEINRAAREAALTATCLAWVVTVFWICAVTFLACVACGAWGSR